MTDKENSDGTTLLKRATTLYPENPNWKREDINTILHWFKQFLGAALGCIAGILGCQGWPTLAVAAFIVVVLTGQYLKRLRIPDDVLDVYEWYTEGAMPAFFTFMLLWIIAYTLTRS